jgi:hypothetical protein
MGVGSNTWHPFLTEDWTNTVMLPSLPRNRLLACHNIHRDFLRSQNGTVKLLHTHEWNRYETIE